MLQAEEGIKGEAKALLDNDKHKVRTGASQHFVADHIHTSEKEKGKEKDEQEQGQKEQGENRNKLWMKVKYKRKSY